MKVFSNCGFVPEATSLSGLAHTWREDAIAFLQNDAPKLLAIVVGAFVTIRVVRCGQEKHYGISRELRRPIKEEFTKQNIKTAGPGRLFVIDPNAAALS